MPWNKRAHTGNLGVHAQKKARQESDNEAEIPSFQMEDQSDQQFEWETGNIEESGDGREASAVEMGSDSESILSELSEDEDVPSSDAAGLNAFLQKAVAGMQEFIKRGSGAAVRGVKGTYAVKVGQLRSKQSQNWDKQKELQALREGVEGGNQLTRWFHKKSPLGHEPPASLIGASTSQSVLYDSTLSTDADESSSDGGSVPPSLPPSTRAPSPVASLISQSESEFDITQSLPEPALPYIGERVEPTSLQDIDQTIASLVDCDEEQFELPQAPEKGLFEPPPTIDVAKLALADIKRVLKPHRDTGAGYKDPKIDLLLRGRLDLMKLFLWQYISTNNGWIASSLHVAHAAERGPWLAKQLRIWTRAYINDRECLPFNQYGRWNVSLLEDEDLAQEIHVHLQGIGKYVKAMDIVHFLDTPEMKARLKLKKTISLATAQRWMRVMDYRWTKNPQGQFVDGHEREDVVEYRQLVFLPFWKNMEPSMRSWTKNIEDARPVTGPGMSAPHIIVWHHDESTFYANDRRKIRWVHSGETAVPYAKGEGASLMVADFVSADYGWLRSPDGTREARVLFKAGKARQGYFTNEDILSQAKNAMDILEEHYPDDKHVLLFDNATTHQKRADDALSARKMPKFTPAVGSNWGVETNIIGADGKPTYGPDGKILKTKVQMRDGTFADGSPQTFYFPEGHAREGVFKGMAVILEERGFEEASKLKAQCKNFKCAKGATSCCCRRVLYNQPDFVNVKSNLEIICEARGFQVIFLPKFHCEMNFIEQCWGYAKRVYRQFPVTSKESDLEHNVLEALESVPLESMRRWGFAFSVLSYCTNISVNLSRFSIRSRRFMDGYQRGLNGKQAAWASKKYRGHRVLPESIMRELDKAHIA